MNVEVTGARILFEIPVLKGIPITQTVVNTWIVMAVIAAACIFITRGMQVHARSRKQIIAEYLVGMANDLVRNNMGRDFMRFAPFIAALFSLSALSSLISLAGLYAPTADLSTSLGWAIAVFVLITRCKLARRKLGGYLKDFAEPVLVMAPLNIISEAAIPVSMAFRHFGNIASGTVVTLLIYAGLAALSSGIFALLPGMAGQLLGRIPILQLGVPALLSIYFDVFTGILQSFIFCMLTMVYIRLACEE